MPGFDLSASAAPPTASTETFPVDSGLRLYKIASLDEERTPGKK